MKYIKKFETFDTKPLGKVLSSVYKNAIENRFTTFDGSSTDSEEITIAPPTSVPDIKRPERTFMPTEKPKVKERSMGIVKTYEEFMMGGDVEIAPVKTPTTPGIVPRPARPFMPTEKPKVKEKPMGTFDEVMNMFFSELNKMKDTQQGKEMLKNIESKYGNL